MRQTRTSAVIIGYISVALNSLSSIILAGLYVRYLGYDTYGLYQMVSSITQYILLFDFGITMTVCRFRVAVLEKKDKVADENLLAHCVGIICVILFLIMTVGSIVYAKIGSIYASLTVEELKLARSMIAFIILQIMCTFVQHFFAGIALSEERYTLVKMLELVKVGLRLVFSAVLVVGTRNVMSIVCVDFFTTVVCMMIVIVYVCKTVTFHIRFYQWDVRLMRTIFLLMLALMLQSFATYVNSAAGKTIIGIVLEKKLVTVYSFAVTINSFFSAIPNSMNSVYVPRATQLVMQKASGETLTDMVIKVGRIQYMFCGAVVSGFFLFGKFFLDLWAGEEAEGAWLCAIFLIVPHLFPLVQNVCLSILTAMNKRLARSLIVTGTSVLNIVLTVLLVKRIGILGAAIGTAVSVVLGNIIITNIYYQKWIGLNVIRMFKEIFSRTTVCILIASVCSAFTLLLPGGALLHLMVGVLVYVSVYTVMLWIYGANLGEKGIVLSLLSRVKKAH